MGFLRDILVILIKPVIVAALSALLAYLTGADGEIAAGIAGGAATFLRSPLDSQK